METGPKKGCIIILGAPNDNKGHLSMMAKTRLIQGAKELAHNPGYKILLTGGIGKHFNQTNLPHWYYAKDFLIKELSVSPDSFLPEVIDSTNTVEDIEMAGPIISKYNFCECIIVTSEFHLNRVQYIVEKVLDVNKKKIKYSYVPDTELEVSVLKELYEHEKQALGNFQSNYRGTIN
jgi:uncharacterized SAM-binding protein YcdF (DUF218 family)